MQRSILAGGLSALAFIASAQAFADSFTYNNARFGTSVSFPADIFSEPMQPPANGDGLTFLSRDGASLAVFGMNNALEQSPAGLVAEAKARVEPGYEVTYSTTGDDWSVVSGHEAGLIFYTRFEFGDDDVIHAVHIKYPPELKAIYDPLIGDIAGSLQGP